MGGLLMIFGQIGGKPWYGNKSRFVQGLTTGPHHIQWAGGNLLPVPRPIAAQLYTRAALDLVETPPRAGRGHDATERVGTDEAVSFPALIWPQTLEGLGVATFNCYRPAVAIRAQDGGGAQGQIRGEKGLNRRRWLAVPRLLGAARGIAPHHHDPDEPPGQHRGPQPTPRVHLGARFAWVRGPARLGLGPSRGRADQVAFCARGAAALLGRLEGELLELGADREAAHRLDRIGQVTDRVLGGIAAVGHGPDVAPGQLLGSKIAEVAGSLTAGPIRDVELVGWLGFEIACEANRDAQAMARPPLEGERHDASDAVQAPKRPGLWAGGAGAMAVPVAAFALAARFFLGRIVQDDPHDLVGGDNVGGPADDGAPEWPSSVLEGAPEEDIES
jgi:hypothetical protein